MFKYNNAGKFVNESIDYPFNILNRDGDPVTDFRAEVNKLIEEIKDEKINKIRYIWIDAGNYCQTEIFLKKVLLETHNEYPVLYLHWLDFIEKNRSIYQQLCQEQIDNSYFINNDNLLKIGVIDHAETIDQLDEYLELCEKLYDNKYIFIFVAKKDIPSPSDWDRILKKALELGNDCYMGILRSEKNYYRVKPYSHLQCREIFNSAILDKEIKDRAIGIVDTLGEELRRPYYFDFLIKELNEYESVSQVPSKFDDSNLMMKIFNNALGGILSHLDGYHTLKEYLDAYYDSTFVKNYGYGEHSRVPFDNYAWAYGIIHCSGKNKFDDVLKTQFCYSNNIDNVDYKAQLEEINGRVVSIFYSNQKDEINKNFDLKEYFLQMIKYSLDESLVCAQVTNRYIKVFDSNTQEQIFNALGERYSKTLESKKDIYSHYMLGIEIGKLLPKIGSHCIENGLNYLFEYVDDDYVIPKCNSNGISVIPVTNFEYEKFVRDGGYSSFYSLNSDMSLNRIATEYYKEIFDFVIGALQDRKSKDCNCLARLLKGYDWEHYKQIAYLLSRKDDINSEAIYGAIDTNYPNKVSYPAKWSDCQNADMSRPFCNPLQPVVCINIFEARAYAKWLSAKINKKVRILNFDPDYLSVIGKDEDTSAESLRQLFILHIENHRDFINTAENNDLFYNKNDIKIKEPSPVGMPNSRFLDIYDFVGNIFETQDTPFTYNYAKNSEEIKQKLKKINEIYIDYNCPGGGLQRSAANWPPEYMGQVPAFLRNQDIGFRIVIDGNEIGSRKHKNQNFENIQYSESIIEILDSTDKCTSDLISYIQLNYANFKNDFAQDFEHTKLFFNSEKKVVFYTHKNTNKLDNKEAIMLIQNEESIFAYHLVGIASVHNSINLQSSIKMIVRKPIISKDLATRRKMKNYSFAEWVDTVELVINGDTTIYEAHPINISNGYFSIFNRKIRHAMRNGREYKKSSLICNTYSISFIAEAQDYKKIYFESFKSKLGANYFLPDWVNIVDFINHICHNASMSNAFSIDTVMTAISTIDTSDLHEQINRKILIQKDHL